MIADWVLFVGLPAVLIAGLFAGAVRVWAAEKMDELLAAEAALRNGTPTLVEHALQGEDLRNQIDKLHARIDELEKSYAADPRRLEIKAEEEAQKTKPTGFMTFSQRKRAAEAALRKKPKA